MTTVYSPLKRIAATFCGVLLGVAALWSCSPANAADPPQGLPRLLDVGSHSCIPCKLMAPVLEDLKRDYSGKLIVEFVDTELPENAQAAKQYKV